MIDRTAGEVVLQAVAAGDKSGTMKPGTGILTVTCYHHDLIVDVTSVYNDMFIGVQGGTVDVRTQFDDGPVVAEVWLLESQSPAPQLVAVKNAPAWALGRALARHTKFSIEGAQSETFHIPNEEVLRLLLGRCRP